MARTPRQRRIRHQNYARTSRQDKLNVFLTQRQVALNGTGAFATFTGAAGENITWTGHAKTVGKGPFILTTTGTLPVGLATGQHYWIHTVVDANTVKLTTRRGGPIAVLTGAGSGTHTITKASDALSMFEYLAQSGPDVLANSTDVDNL
jgi:hypothetical protein